MINSQPLQFGRTLTFKAPSPEAFPAVKTIIPRYQSRSATMPQCPDPGRCCRPTIPALAPHVSGDSLPQHCGSQHYLRSLTVFPPGDRTYSTRYLISLWFRGVTSYEWVCNFPWSLCCLFYVIYIIDDMDNFNWDVWKISGNVIWHSWPEKTRWFGIWKLFSYEKCFEFDKASRNNPKLDKFTKEKWESRATYTIKKIKSRWRLSTTLQLKKSHHDPPWWKALTPPSCLSDTFI